MLVLKLSVIVASMCHRFSRNLLLVLVVTLAACCFYPAVANAQSVLTVDPAFQEVLLTIDETEAETTISYSNESSESIELELFAYDFTQTDLLGSVGMFPADVSYPHTLASFLEFEQNKLIVNPKEKKNAVIRVRNRASLTPGGHYAAVVARVFQRPADAATQQVVPAISALILVRKTGGEQYHLSLSNTSWSPGTIEFSIPEKIELLFRNDGNVHDIPRGSVTVKNVFGTTLYQGTINESSLYVLPGTQRRIPVTLRNSHWLLPIEVITVATNGTAQFSTVAYQREESLILVRWQFIVFVVLLVAVGVGIWRWQKRRRK